MATTWHASRWIERTCTVTFTEGGRCFLERELLYWDAPRRRYIRVHLRMGSDGMSNPSIGWVVVGHPYSYSMLPSSFLHDGCLQGDVTVTDEYGTLLEATVISDAEASTVFYEALRADGRGVVRARLAWVGTWAGNGKRWLRRRGWWWNLK